MDQTAQDRNRLVATPEAAQYLGLSPRRLVVWRMEKIGPRYVDISSGRRRPVIRYKLADLDAFVESRAVETQQ